MRIDYDTHLHTSYSTDSNTDLHDQVEAARKLGLKGICITDHTDYDFPLDQCPGFSGVPFVFDIDEYKSDIQKERENQPNFEILTGVECGLQTDCDVVRKNRVLSEDPEFDQIIGSIHLIDKKDPYYPAFWENQNAFGLLQRYFELTLENIHLFSAFDTLGHLDYAVRYAPRDFVYHPSDFFEITDEIMRFLIQNNKALEINTSPLKKGYGSINPHPDFIKRYYELGGRQITIGSDAHTTDALAYEFDSVADQLMQTGFTGYVIYRKHLPEFHHFNMIL